METQTMIVRTLGGLRIAPLFFGIFFSASLLAASPCFALEKPAERLINEVNQIDQHRPFWSHKACRDSEHRCHNQDDEAELIFQKAAAVLVNLRKGIHANSD